MKSKLYLRIMRKRTGKGERGEKELRRTGSKYNGVMRRRGKKSWEKKERKENEGERNGTSLSFIS